MSKLEIKTYLTAFREHLANFGVSPTYAAKIADSVRERMTSLLHHWSDEAFRKAALFIGYEEGVHYLPKVANPDVAPFVVVTVRNSLLETACSNDHKKAGLDKPLSVAQITEITGAAIRYFAEIDFEKLPKDTSDEPKSDFYQDCMSRLPTAATALVELANSEELSHFYATLPVSKYEIPPSALGGSGAKSSNARQTLLCGIDEKIDAELYAQMRRVAEERGSVFYAPSFKMVSRHFGKLLMVMEYLLTRDVEIVTNNYLIACGGVQKRSGLPTKPPSSWREVAASIRDLGDCQKEHRRLLQSVRESFR